MLWTRGLAWAWRYAGVQEVSIGNGSVAVRLRRGAGMTWAIYGREQHLEYVVRVYECGCRDLGENGRLHAVLLGRAAGIWCLKI